METQTERLVQSDEGSGITDTTNVNEQVGTDQVQEPTGTAETRPEAPVPPAGYENSPPELWPDKDGNPPKLTEELIKRLRGKYFTVKHVLLRDCGHKLDMINQPKNNCENCWFQFFNTHPQLVETADQFYRTQGRNPMIGMRGLKFVKMFVRYMATIIGFMRQEGRLPNESSNPERTADGTESISISSGLITE